MEIGMILHPASSTAACIFNSDKVGWNYFPEYKAELGKK